MRSTVTRTDSNVDAETGGHGRALRGPGDRVGVEPVIDMRGAEARAKTEPRERGQQHRRVDAAAERDEETRRCLAASANALRPSRNAVRNGAAS